MVLIDLLFACVPGKLALIRWGARWPVQRRSAFSSRFFGKLVRIVRAKQPRLRLQTNLGIDNQLRIDMPITAMPNSLFGRPEYYAGERSVLFLGQHLAAHCDAIADIGANWGYHSYFYASVTALPVYFFEPNATLFDNTVRNAASNSLQLIGSCQAVAAKTGPLRFFINRSDDLSSSVSDSFAHLGHEVELVEIPAVAFDDFVQVHSKYQRWLLKVDVECAEAAFLQGATHSLASGTVAFLIIELLQEAREQKLVDQLIAQGWFAYYLNDLQIESVTADHGGYSSLGEYNWLFCKHDATALRDLLRGSPFTVKAAATAA